MTRSKGKVNLPGADPESDTETFIALKCLIDNWRWAGVPFFLRTGKRMSEGQRIISIAFREPPKSMFPADSGIGSQGPDQDSCRIGQVDRSDPRLVRQAIHDYRQGQEQLDHQPCHHHGQGLGHDADADDG